jgi:hypothetical protein
MNAEIVTQQILSLVNEYCKPNVVTSLMREMQEG